MFPMSTQCKYWIFKSEDELNKLRERANLRHIQTYGRHVNVSILKIVLRTCTLYLLLVYFKDTAKYEVFLTPDEEKVMVKRYEQHLRDFCKRFQPPMPRYVVGTAFHYFKRFYINNSVMNYHPKEIM